MEINNLSLTALSNEAHFKYHTDVDGLVQDATPDALQIKAEYSDFNAMLINEKEALGKVRKSTFTGKLHDADLLRDTTLRGMKKAIESGLNHFKESVRDAAGNLIVLMDTYGSITKKSYEKESGAILKLVADLKGKYAADAEKVGISDWVTELEANNKAFDDLMKNRYNEEDDKTRLHMKQERVAIDKVYHSIVKRINAAITLNGEAAFAPFVNKLNLRIDAYSRNRK